MTATDGRGAKVSSRQLEHGAVMKKLHLLSQVVLVRGTKITVVGRAETRTKITVVGRAETRIACDCAGNATAVGRPSASDAVKS